MSGNNLTLGWMLDVRHRFSVDPSALKYILTQLQTLLRFSLQNNFRNIKLNETPINQTEFEHFLNDDWSNITDLDYCELYCIPDSSIPELQATNRSALNKSLSKIGAFITSNEEIVFLISLHIIKGVLPFKPLTLIPELESSARKAVIEAAQEQGYSQLSEFLQQAKFTNFSEGMIVSQKPIYCNNFFALLEKPILKSQAMQYAASPREIAELLPLDQFEAMTASPLQRLISRHRLSSPFISDSPLQAIPQSSPDIAARQLELQNQFDHLSEIPEIWLPEMPYSPQMSKNLASSSSSAAATNLASTQNIPPAATPLPASWQGAIDVLRREQEALMKHQVELMKHQQEQHRQYELTLQLMLEQATQETTNTLIGRLNFPEKIPSAATAAPRRNQPPPVLFSDREAAAPAAAAAPFATQATSSTHHPRFSQYGKSDAESGEQQLRRSPRFDNKRQKRF